MTDTSQPAEFETLAGNLEQLKADKAALAAAEANAKELEKILGEARTVHADYLAKHPDLARRDADLRSFRDKTKKNLEECHVAGKTGQIDSIVAAKVAEIDAKHAEIDKLTGKTAAPSTWEYLPIPKAEKAVADAQTKFDRAKAHLDRIRTLPKALDARLKAAEKLQTDIEKLLDAGKYAEAWWLLTGKRLVDSAGDVLVPGSTRISAHLDGCPSNPLTIGAADSPEACPTVIAPGDYPAALKNAWDWFVTARNSLATAQADLKAAQDRLAAWQGALSKLEKDFVTSIRAHLAQFPTLDDCADAPPDADTPEDGQDTVTSETE
ncbi:hypothetical protein HKCCE3408_15705 [Rhodobacterales bacterium HKCCE3408]|nr:hypothetical protein [Rhodobacterales bacterium HKCCE3408]